MSPSNYSPKTPITREMVYYELCRYMAAWLRLMLEESEELSGSPLSYYDLFYQFKSTFCHCIDLQDHFDNLLLHNENHTLALHLDKMRRRSDGLERGLVIF